MTESLDPDQIASSEAIWFGTTFFQFKSNPGIARHWLKCSEPWFINICRLKKELIWVLVRITILPVSNISAKGGPRFIYFI